jgi:phosphomannomutase/phosphoglucomutase
VSIFKACDIRAPYGDELKDHHATDLGHALAGRQGPVEVVVAGDGRKSTPRLKSLLVEALVSGGCRVIDLGMVPTPALYFARQQLGVVTGVMVTASHNPPNHNGFKLALGELPITEAEIEELRLMMEGDFRPSVGAGSVSNFDILPGYLDFASSQLEPCSGLRVVVDYGNGVGALTGPTLWQASGAEVMPLFDTVDGSFPNRSPNPAVADNLTALCQAVVRGGADLGVAYDGDADRVAFVDDGGQVMSNDKIIAMFAAELLKAGPGVVVYDQKCSRIVAQRVRALGGEPVMEKSGHTFIKTTFKERDAVYAGELSGHHFFRQLPQGDDGVFASLFFAGRLKGGGVPLSALAAALPTYPITPDIRLPVAPGEVETVLSDLARALVGEAQLVELDGVRAEFPDGWGLARKSVTEPLITLRFEGDDRAALERIVRRFEVAAPALAGRLLEGL